MGEFPDGGNNHYSINYFTEIMNLISCANRNKVFTSGIVMKFRSHISPLRQLFC